MTIAITTLALLFILCAFVWMEQKKKKEKSKNAIYKDMGIFLYRKYRRKRIKKNAYQEALAVSDEEMENRYGQSLGYGLLLIFIGAFLSLIFSLKKTERITSYERPSFGEKQEISVVVKTEDQEEVISFFLNGQNPTEEEMKIVFDESFEKLKTIILGDNESFDCVREDLNLVEELENGICAQYESNRKDIFSDYGYILADIPKEGEQVTLWVELSFDTYSQSYEIKITLFPAQDNSSFLERLQKEIEETEEKSKSGKIYVLPTSFEGTSMIFEEEQLSPYSIFLLFILVAFGLIMLLKEQEQQEIRRRKEFFEEEYPSFLLKLSMLIHAGISIRGSFNYILEAYEKKEELARREKEKKTPNYLLKELKQSMNLMNGGLSETEVYISLGRRTENQQYIKLGNILCQSVRQGVSGLETQLQDEMKEAISLKQTRAIRKGEQATTKQLFPMILMLLVVIIILLVPTLLTF